MLVENGHYQYFVTFFLPDVMYTMYLISIQYNVVIIDCTRG